MTARVRGAKSTPASKKIGAARRQQRRLFRHFEAVSDAAQRLQVLRVAGILFDFLAQTADININRAWSHEWRFLPHGVEKLITGEDASAMIGEVLEQPELSDRGEHIAAVDLHRHGEDVDLHTAEPQNAGGSRGLA